MIPRADALAALERDSFDLVVVGGGITGAGVAFDAASRGYSVALVERADYAAGTSSRSSKLIHGGLRYLQNFDLGLVREALLERSLLVKLAPHLVKPLPLLVPSFEGKRPDRLTGVGLNMYDAMSWRRRDDDEEWSPARHRTLDGAETAEMLPALAEREPTAAYLFYDCQTDDARLVLTVLGEAERFGAVCANGCEVTGLVERAGRAAGVIVRDTVGGGEFELTAANVVNATGVWADRLRPDELYEEEEVPRIRPSRGTHLLLARESLAVDAGAIVPAGSGRTIFVLPWLGRTLVGTTDNDYEGSLDHVPPGEEDVAYLLAAVNGFFETSLGTADLTGAYAGVRPLISTGDPKKSVDISRKAELYETSSGLVTITGGKLTTWRRMAKMAVDRIVEREWREAPCRTHEIPLGEPLDPMELPEVAGVDGSSRAHLAARYGHAAREVMTLAASSPELARRISPALPDLAAEAAYAARREQALTLADALLRRTRLGLLDARGLSADGAGGSMLAARAMAGELGWDDERVRLELERWRDAARAEGLVPGPRPIPPATEGGRPRGDGTRGSGVIPFTIAQLSDLHCGSPFFVPTLLDRAIVEVNELEPDVVVVSGDLTGDGLRAEYELAAEYLSRIGCKRMIVIPGNHDSRNVGYVHFEELFGERRSELHYDGVSILAVDSTEPDLDHGVIGRGRYEWIEERFAAHDAYLRIFVLHHHLLPVPGTGRERNVVHDAGDTLECLQRADVHLVLSGHKHVPYAWRLENLFVVNAGTVSTTRLRGKTKPCYNLIEAGPERVRVLRKYPFHEQDAILSFDPRTYEYEKHRSLLGETFHG